MMHELTFRDFQPTDYDRVLALWLGLDLTRPERNDTLESIRRTLAMGGRLLIAEDPDSSTIIGTAWITDDGRRLHLHHCAVAPDWQSRGVGKQLVEEVLQIARDKGMQVKLEVHRTNDRARRLYERCGFEYLGDYLVCILRKP